MHGQMDEKDKEIAGLLIEDSSLTKKRIARKLGMPLTTVHNRIAKMEREGVIRGYGARMDWKKMGLGLSALIQITVKYEGSDYSQEETAKRIRALAGVEWVAIVAGTTDIVAKVRSRDTEGLNDFILQHLRKIKGVDKTTTLVVLKEYE